MFKPSINHRREEQKKQYLPKMVSCEWTGTMNLTEPHCGTDLGLMTTKAVAQKDNSYKMIKTNNIHYSYGELEVLKGVSIEIQKGEFVSIVGPSGAGKTTLLQILGTLEKIQSGSITINNKNINELKEKELAIFRNKEIGFVFQFHNLLAEFTVLENVCLPAFIKGTKKKEAEKGKKKKKR